MPNKSKLKEPRFWSQWRRQGKVGTYMSSSNLVAMAQKAFALAINEMTPAIRPLAQDVEVTVQGSDYRCRWNKDDVNYSWITVEGSFIRHSNEPLDQGTVCISYVCEWMVDDYPYTWSHHYSINELYEMMHNHPAYVAKEVPYEDIECPGCDTTGMVGKNFIGGGAAYSGHNCYCYGCGTTF